MRTCEFCQKPLLERQKRFCSRDCLYRGAVLPARIPERPCERCGKVFRPKQRQNAGRFCSRSCLYEEMRGEKAANWKGGRMVKSDGYVLTYAPDHPTSRRQKGYVLEHRLVMEQHLGRLLESHETVHHKNGDRQDNRIENLELWSGRHGKGQRNGHCATCTCLTAGS